MSTMYCVPTINSLAQKIEEKNFMRDFIYSLFFVFLSLNSLYADHPLSSDRFHVCTVASYTNVNLNKLILSCNKHHIDLEIIGLGLPYYGNGTKLFHLNEYLNSLNDDDIVMFVDAFDVLVIADKEVILKKFIDMNVPFVMSAEKGCFPFADLANKYPKTSSPFKFINSGCYIGYVHNLKTWLRELSPLNLETSDQGQITIHYLKNKYVFAIDYYCELFLSLYQVRKREIAIKKNGVLSLKTGSKPCVVHANGKSFYLWNIIYEKLVLN